LEPHTTDNEARIFLLGLEFVSREAIYMVSDMIDPAELEGYNRWLEEHFDEVCRKYPGRYIGVYRNEIVAVGDSYQEVYRLAREGGVPHFPFVLAVPQPEEMAAALPSVFYPGS
jgi:Family of unknown function (DUF5678)